MAQKASQEMTAKRRYSFYPDTKLPFPELYWSVYVVGSPHEQKQFAELFVRAHCNKADSLDKADIVVFSGGADVNPALYGEHPHVSTCWDAARDQQDMNIYYKCVHAGIPMVGICRGAQFLHVMNGGKLFQDVDQHHGDHGIWSLVGKEIIHRTSSVHHQMVMPNPEGGMEVVAHVKGRSTRRALNPKVSETGVSDDIEAFFYRDTCCFGVQGHPEYRGYYEYQQWFIRMLEHFFNYNADLGYKSSEHPNCLRVKPDILEARLAKWEEEMN